VYQLTLAYQEADADPRHVETIEPGLNIKPDVLRLFVLLPLEDALCDSCHCGIMTPLDGF